MHRANNRRSSDPTFRWTVPVVDGFFSITILTAFWSVGTNFSFDD